MSNNMAKCTTVLLASVLLFVIVTTAATSCDFTGQCVYNLKVHHCNQTVKRNVRTSSGSCDCTDLEIVQGETYNLQSSFKSLEAEFNNLVAKYQTTKAILQKRQQQLEQAIAENKATESKIQRTDYLQNKTMESVNRQKNNWNNEKVRLETLTTQNIKDLQTCRATLAASKTDTGHGGLTGKVFVFGVNHKKYLLFVTLNL